jgi:outer membrane protein assembly factor BamB
MTKCLLRSALRETSSVLAAVFFAVGMGPTQAATVAGPAWLQPAYDAGQTWVNPKETLLNARNVKQLHEVWQRQVGQFYVGPTTQSNGTLLVCSNLSGLSAIDLTSFSTTWSRSGFSGGNCGAAALTASTAFVTASNYQPGLWTNTLTAVNRLDGATAWQVFGPPDDPNQPASFLGFNNPTLAHGSLYVANGRSLVSAYDASTGQLRWRAQTNRLNNQTTVAHDLVFTSTWGSTPNLLFAHKATNGELAWSQPVDNSNSQYPAASAAGRVFVGSDNGLLKAFDAVSGAPLWERQLSGYVSAPLVVSATRVVINHGLGSLTSLSATTGEAVWSVSLAGSDRVSSNLVLANGLLYFTVQDFSGSGYLTVINGNTGKRAARLPMNLGSYASINVVGGRVHVSSSSGALQVYALP